MLKASSSGNVFLKRLFIFHHEQQQVAQLGAHAHARARTIFACRSPQIRLSSFSARFAAHFAPATSAFLDADAWMQMQFPIWDDVAERKHARSVYLPWARSALLPVKAGRKKNGTKGLEKAKKGVGKKAKQAGKSKANASERRHRVNSAKAGRQRERLRRKARGFHSEGDENIQAKADAGESPPYESAKQPRKSQLSKDEAKARKKIRALVDSLGDDVQVQDLSIEELHAIILDKRTDLLGIAWDAYQRLVYIDAEEGFSRDNRQGGLFGTELLTTLANRLVARRKYHPKNCREIFLRLLSVYARLRRERAVEGGMPYLKTLEWNCLIHFAGTGLRGRTSLEAYNAALDVYDDMLRGVEEAKTAGCDSLLNEIEPDIYTYTSLLSIALRTQHQPAVDNAMKLLRDSGKEPSRITRLSMARHRYRLDGLPGVRALLSLMRPEDIGPDGVNAYIVCAGDEGDLDVVRNVYDTVRRNVEEHEDGTYGPLSKQSPERQTTDAKGTEGYVLVDGVRLPRTLVPSEVMYNYVIQVFAYYGRLSDALQVFTDMLSTRRPDGGGFFQPNYTAFRGLFLGFARHGYRQGNSAPTMLTLMSENVEWTWDRFSIILDAFIDLGDKIQPSERMVYWIMTAVRRMTGDEQLLRDVWERLNKRWYIRKGGRLKTLDIKYGQREGEDVHTRIDLYRGSSS